MTNRFRHPLIVRADDVPTYRNREPLVVTIPLEKTNLPKELSPNFRSRSHWPKTRALAQARYEAEMETLQLVDPGNPFQCFQTSAWPLTLHVVIARTGRAQVLDDDNAWSSLKAYRDGIASAIGVEDVHFRLGTIQQVRSDTGRAYLRIALEPRSVEGEVAA